MNAEEIAAVLGMIQASWPAFQMAEETALMWASQLNDLDPVDGHEALQLILKNDERPPSIARFRTTALEVGRRRRMEASRVRGLQPGAGDRAVPKDVGLQRIAELRDQLRTKP